MNDSSFASLSPTLLARKGGAKPAMRPQIAPLHGDKSSSGAALAANLEDLGWNDMGEEHALPEQTSDGPLNGLAGLTPEPVTDAAPSPAKQQLEELASRLASDGSADASDSGKAPAAAADAHPAKPRRSALARGKRAAFTLRLDADRHLKLRLASTVRGRSAQALMTEALDRLLGDMPEIDKMAAQAATQGTGK